MKRTGFKRLTFAEAVQKQNEARERQRARAIERKAEPKPKKKKTKAERIKTLKANLWTAFSQYIRKRHADPMTGYVMTCDGFIKHWKETHCGHLIHNTERSQSLGGNELWFYENNFAPQSAQGNYFNANDSAKKYMLWAVKKYGSEEVDKMWKMKLTPRQYTEEELSEKLAYYRSEFAKL